jgi:recombination endonuclease VII
VSIVLSSNRRRTIKRLYGLTEADLVSLYDAAEGRCPMCLRPFNAGRAVNVEHDHASGLLRGLACAHCNHDLLGHFGDDPAYYARVAAYLLAPPAVDVLGLRYVPGSPPTLK